MAETNEKDNKKKEGTAPPRRQTQQRYRKPAQKTAPSKAAAKPVSQRTAQTKGNTAARKTTAGTKQKTTGNTRRYNSKQNTKPLRIILLGGLGEIGKNITLYEYDGDMFLVDCGMSFPDEETPGIDIVIPDFTYILENKDKMCYNVLRTCLSFK